MLINKKNSYIFTTNIQVFGLQQFQNSVGSWKYYGIHVLDTITIGLSVNIALRSFILKIEDYYTNTW